MTNEELQNTIDNTLYNYNSQESGNVQTELYKHLCELLEEQRRRAQEKQS